MRASRVNKEQCSLEQAARHEASFTSAAPARRTPLVGGERGRSCTRVCATMSTGKRGAWRESTSTDRRPSGSRSECLTALVDHEAVHPEHTAHYSGRTLGRLFTMCGLRLSKLGYYKCEPLTRLSLNGIVSNVTEHMLALLWPQLSEWVVAEARIAAT